MRTLVKIAAGAAVVAISTAAFAFEASKQDRETILLPDDKLAVTLGASGLTGSLTDETDYSIWVGEVELGGRKAVWVELIDDHGEVVYDSEVRQNETHLLPDGRAIVVRALQNEENAKTRIAKQDESRVAPDARLVVTRRVVDDPANQSTIEFIEEKPQREQSALTALADFGNHVWTSIVVVFHAAADSVKTAWSWLFGSAQA
ncbi:hypothetical protein [Stappia albiluteola]|uniref:hypothetical protein n=1 Tax=Stappia albiluteola TaxID=2758565 RepID=UPI001AD91C2F|nr:hypothetical protein [Stappia albiluteola]